MITRCAWCGRMLGHSAPMEDERITHGMCRPCFEATCPITLTTRLATLQGQTDDLGEGPRGETPDGFEQKFTMARQKAKNGPLASSSWESGPPDRFPNDRWSFGRLPLVEERSS
jgi:hypothetical protein